MRLTRILPIILLLTACAPAVPVPTATPLPPTLMATAAPTSTSTMEPTATETATSTAEPTSTNTTVPTEVPVVLPAELAAQIDRLTDAQRKNLGGKAEDTRWKVDVYNAIKSGSPNLKLTLGIWENPGVDNDVEVVYKLPSDPSVIYLPGTKLWENHTLPPAEITEDMMHNQEVVGKYTQVVTKEMEKKSGIPAGSKFAKVNGDLVYLSSEGVEAKLNVETGIFEQQVVRNAEGQIPLESGVSVEVTNIKKISKEGLFAFSEGIDGITPFPGKNYQWPVLPDGYEYTVVVMKGFGTSENNMRPWGSSVSFWLDNQEDDGMDVRFIRSTPKDQWAVLVIGIPHKVGNEVKGLGLMKASGAAIHLVFRADDPVTKDLLPR